MSRRAGAAALAARIRAGDMSSREALEAARIRIEAHNPALDAVVTLDLDRAAERADAADAATARGEWWGPFHGVPMTVKDAFETAGLRTTSGATELADHVPDRDAVAVARLRAAGAVIVGKTNLPPYAGDLQTSNELFGTTNNPWALDRTAGGSSGGAAAALAAGLVPLELGSDIGGSIRNPAHYCGVYGLKPTYGLVPVRGHIPPAPGVLFEPEVGVAGPMARHIEDLVLALGVLAGPTDEHTAGWTLSLPPAERRDGVRGLRIGYCDHDPDLPVSAASRKVLRAAADRLADAGAIVTEVAMPVAVRDGLESWQDLVLPAIGAGLPDAVYDLLETLAPPGPDAEPGMRAGPALAASFRSWARAVDVRGQRQRRWATAAAGHDVLMLPVMPTEAHPHDVDRPYHERRLDVDGTAVPHVELLGWCGTVGAMSVPSLSLPVGLTAGGLPVGAQLVGPLYGDLGVLAAARAVDEVLGGVGDPPGFEGP